MIQRVSCGIIVVANILQEATHVPEKTRKTYKGKVYETYALTESYRENGKVKLRHIANLSSLSEEQAQRIRLILKAKQIEDAFVGHLFDVVVKEHYRFLDVAVLDAI